MGEAHTHYDANPASAEAERRAFRSDAAGTVDWLDFREPRDEGGGYPHRWSPEMETTAAALGLSDAAREVSLDLVLAEVDSGDELRMRGPTLWIPDRIWHERPPKPKVLGLLAALNPFEPGGVVQTLARGAKYAGCIEERRSAKRRFAHSRGRRAKRFEACPLWLLGGAVLAKARPAAALRGRVLARERPIAGGRRSAPRVISVRYAPRGARDLARRLSAGTAARAPRA